jgi:hypothetical protein
MPKSSKNIRASAPVPFAGIPATLAVKENKCHPERVSLFSHQIDLIADNMPVFGCVEIVQANSRFLCILERETLSGGTSHTLLEGVCQSPLSALTNCTTASKLFNK